MASNKIAASVKSMRKKLGLTQAEAADRAGVGLRFLREVEQGKTTVRMDKLNDLLFLFGMELSIAPLVWDEEEEQ